MGFAKGFTHPTNYELRSVARQAVLNLHDGQITEFVSIPLCKNISVFNTPKSHLELFASHLTRGALAIVTNAGRDAVDAAASGAQRDAGQVDEICERSNGELTNDVVAYGEVVWS
jgi:hypothetical protein